MVSVGDITLFSQATPICRHPSTLPFSESTQERVGFLEPQQIGDVTDRKLRDPNLVGALSDHKEGSKAFARYRDIDEEMKQDLVNILG